jgi:Zn-finger nucleic acid-binding protein
MDCPTCHSAMITLELAEVEIDHCVECGGIWLDSGELELLIGDGSQALTTLGSLIQAPASAERPRKCPLCDKRMAKVQVGSANPALVIDRCPKGDGLWFDRDELRQILTGSNVPKDSKVLQLLTDMFGSIDR